MGPFVIRQGDIYWVDLGEPFGSEPGFRRPYVVIQSNLINATRIESVLVCALTTSERVGQAPGNVSLREGEAHLPQASVVNVSQIATFDRARLTDFGGSLSPARVREVVNGIHLLIEPREPPTNS